jgi:hypothetical protein
MLFVSSDDVKLQSDLEWGEEDIRQEYLGSTGPNTPLYGTPMTPSTPVSMVPAKHESVHDNQMKETISRDLLSKFVDDAHKGDTKLSNESAMTLSGHSTLVEDTRVEMVITHDSLRDESSGQDGRKKQLCHLSTGSTGSSLTTNKMGFIANEFFVRDALHILHQCVQTLSAEIPNIDPSAYDTSGLFSYLQCSIGVNEVKPRMTRLKQYVSEGLWRFQLTAHQNVPFEYGKIIDDFGKLDFEFHSEDEDLGISFILIICIFIFFFHITN